MRKKIVVANRFEQVVFEKLKEKMNVTRFYNILSTENKEYVNELEDADGLIGLGMQVNKELLDSAPNLKIVSNVSVGYNNLDVEEMTKRNIMATNTPGVLSDTVADTMFGLLLATARRIPELDHYVKARKWKGDLPADYYGVDVHHKTLGIIGMGRIGNAIAQRAHHGFHMNILYNSRSRKPDAEEQFDAKYRSVDDIMAESDYVILITPLTKEKIGRAHV